MPESRNCRRKSERGCAVVAITEIVLASDIIYDGEVAMMKELRMEGAHLQLINKV